MFEIISSKVKIDFVGKFSVTTVLSGILVLVALYGLFGHMRYGVDFRGGAEIQTVIKEGGSLKSIRDGLKEAGFKGAQVQTIGEASLNEFLIKVQGKESELNTISENVRSNLQDKFGIENVDVRKVDIVGPKAGAELRKSGFLAMLWALIAIMVYIGLRFDFKYSPGAIAALFHDVSIILGIFAFTGTEFTLQTVAALLAVIGYSVNDTVIVYDRVREHEDKYGNAYSLKEHINNAVNETLSRTVLTSGTTLFVSLAMFFFGGPAIKDFFFAITLGVIIGTYSSIFIAAPVTLLFDKLLGEKVKSEVRA